MRNLVSQLLLAALGCLSLLAAPKEVEEAFKDKYPKAEEPKWKSEPNDIWEGNFEVGEIKYRSYFKSDGTWVETEHDIEYDELPKEVRSAVELKYDPQDVRDVEAVESPTHGIFYDVEFQSGAEKVDVMFDPRGKVLDPAVPPTEGGFLQFWVGEADQSNPLQKSGPTLIYKALFNLLTILIYAYLIYYRRHHDHKMLFLLLSFNLFLFPIFLSSSLVTAGFGFTIFALLALVRLRSEAFDKAEIGYLLGSICLTFVNTMLPLHVDLPAAAIILLTAYLADKPAVWRDDFQKIEIDYRISEKERMLDHSYLRKALSDEYLIDVRQININRVLKNEIRLTATYRKLNPAKHAELVVQKEIEREEAELQKKRLEEERRKAELGNQPPQ